MAAGTMGAGAVSTLVLAGAWFQYSLIWVVVAIAPFFVIAVDTASRIGSVNPHDGVISLISRQLNPGVSWLILLINLPVHFLIIMGQISVMTSSLQSFAGLAVTAGRSAVAFDFALSLLVAGGMLWFILSKGYERIQSVMSALNVMLFVCFLIIAIRGFMEFRLILNGLIPSLPSDLPITGETGVRLAGDSIIAIIGSALAPAALLGMPYLNADSGAGVGDMKQNLKSTVLNLGVIFTTYSIFILIAGGFALYPRPNHASIDTVDEAGRILAVAFPAAIAAIGPMIFSLGLFVAALTTAIVAAQVSCYILLDGLGQNWHFSKDNRRFFHLMIFFILGPAIVAPFWDFPALLKIVLLMGLNIVVMPIVLVAIIFLSRKKAIMKNHTAGLFRTGILAVLLLAALAIGAHKLPLYLELLPI